MYFAMMFDRIDQRVECMELCEDLDDAVQKCTVFAAHLSRSHMKEEEKYNLEKDGVLKFNERYTFYIGAME